MIPNGTSRAFAPPDPAPAPVLPNARRKLLSAKWDGFDTFTVEQTGEIFGLCRNAVYAAVRNGTIESIRIGKRYIVPRRVVEELLGF